MGFMEGVTEKRSASSVEAPSKYPKLEELLAPARNNFDLVRLIAALAVIFGHAYALSPKPAGNDPFVQILRYDYSGSFAVKVFFFISGLLVAHSIFRDRSAFSFIMKRIFRIFPALIICNIICVFAIGFVFTTKSALDYLSSVDIYRYLLNNSILRDIQWRIPGVFEGSKFGLNGSLWTLPWEWLCYMYVFIGISLGMFLSRWVALSAAFLVFFLYFTAPTFLGGFQGGDEAYWLLPCFLMGVIMAALAHLVVIRIEPALGLWTAFYLSSQPILSQALFYLASFYTITLIASSPFVVKRMRLPVDASYGVYLYGFPIQQSLFYMFPSSKVWHNQVSAMLIALGLGVLSSYLIEQPAVKAGRSLIRQLPELIKRFRDISLSTLHSFWMKLKLNRRNALEFLAYVGMAALGYAVALAFIYPGYLDPLWPHHSDFYLLTDLRAGPIEALKYLTWSRPVGVYTLALLGNAPMRVGIAIVASLTILNAAICGYVFSRFLSEVNKYVLMLLSFAYFFTLFSSPGFYIFYSQDVWAQTSFFLLLIGSILFYLLMNVSVMFASAALFFCALLAFLSKETYAPSYLVLAGAFVLLSHWRTWLWRVLPGVLIAGALGAALVVGILGRSVFFGHSGMGAYAVNLSPSSILAEFWRYATGGVSSQLALALLITVVAVAWTKRALGASNPAFLGFVAALAGAAAWLPNSVLPNHFFPGYSWNGAYLFFLPIFLLALLWNGLWTARLIGAVLLATLLLNPVLNRGSYAHGDWVVLQEKIQRNYWLALKREIRALPLGVSLRVLVTGQTFPFSPFAHPKSLDELKKGRDVRFSVVEYPPFNGQASGDVTFLPLGAYNLRDYDLIWVFRPDGTLLKALDQSQLASIPVPEGLTAGDLLSLPSLLEKVLSGAPVDACLAMDAAVAGNALAFGKAFVASCRATSPNNAYIWFNMGIVLQGTGDMGGAIEAFSKAIELDSPTQPNPLFRQRLNAAQAAKST